MLPVIGTRLSRVLPHNGILAGLMLFAPLFSSDTSAQIFGGEQAPPPQVSLARAEIDVDVPMLGNDLEALLALVAAGKSLSAAKEEATEKFSAQLREELDAQLRGYLTDQEVPLIGSGSALTLHTVVDLSVSKELADIKTGNNHEVERGSLNASGDFTLQLRDPGGKVLREKHVDISDLRLQESYQIKSPKDGSAVEDNTQQQLQLMMVELAERLLDRVEGDLEADSLRDLAP